MGKKTPKIAPSYWDFVTLPEEDRSTAIDNMQKIGKVRACSSGDILVPIHMCTYPENLVKVGQVAYVLR